jgi:hypothetical protein
VKHFTNPEVTVVKLVIPLPPASGYDVAHANKLPSARSRIVISRLSMASLALIALVGCSGGTEPTENTSVTFSICDATWVAVQDGDGAWTHVLPTSGWTYDLSFKSGRGAIARVRNPRWDNQYHLDILYGTLAELRQASTWPDISYCSATVAMTGSVVDTLAGYHFAILLGASYSSVGQFLENFTAFGYPGKWDMVATRTAITGQTVTKMIIRRDIDVVAGGTLARMDFDGPEAFAIDTSTVTISNSSPTDVQTRLKSTFFGAHGAAVVPMREVLVTDASAPFTHETIPAGQFAPGEFQVLEVIALGSGAVRQAGVYTRAPKARTLTLGPGLNTPSGSVVDSLPNMRMQVQVTTQVQYNRTMTAGFEQEPDLSGRRHYVEVTQTSGYLGMVPPTWTITVPDLSGAEGWDPLWGLNSDLATTWWMRGVGGTIPLLDRSVPDGADFHSASKAPL